MPRFRRSLTVLLVAVAGLCSAVAAPAAAATAGGATTSRAVGPFRGLGTWVDAFDYAPAFQNGGVTPPVTAATIPDMAALGVKTLYLQAAMNDERAPDEIVDVALVGDLLVRAHRAGILVVAWYFPTLSDPAVDLEHVRAMVDFRSHGQRFDGFALDVESTQGLPDVADRSDRAVHVAAEARKLVGNRPLGAVVYPAVQLEVLNPVLWPKFPYKRMAKSVDVWMPMAYWTFRSGDYRDPYAYTVESVARLRADLGDKHALVHPIGGIGDATTTDDLRAFARAVEVTRAIGWSVYDYNTTLSSAWPDLRALGTPAVAATTSPPPSSSP